MKMRTRSARQSQGAATSNVALIQSQGAGTANAALIPNPAQTVVRINQAQSIHIVQTTVSAALCTILWINEYFPDDHFETRSYSLDDPAFPYRIKTQAQTAEERTEQGDEKARVTWDFLRRGKTKEADKIWLWLDGVCDAIKRGYLATFQISFHIGEVSRDTIAVAYVLRFSYSENGGKVQLDILAGSQEVEVTAEDLQNNLKSMFVRLMKMSQDANILPEDPTISLQLTYNESCPSEYEPMGFVAAPDSSIIMDDQNGMNIGDIDTKYHRVGMNLVIPPKTAGHDSNGSFGAATRSNSRWTSNQSNLASIPATASPYDGSSILNTQQCADRELIRGMVPLGREVGETQRLQDTQSQRAASERSSHSQPRGPTEQDIPPPDERRFYFNRDAIREIYPAEKWRNGQIRVSHSEAQDIKCDCGKKFAGMTVQCEICQRRQHLLCHGYLETDVMDTHVCYKCLLDTEPDLRNEMQGLCLLRHVAWVASMEKYPLKEADLAVRIGCLVKDVIAMSQRLVQEKYLRKVSKPQSKTHKDYHRRSQIPPYQFVMEEKGRLFKEYLNPTFRIEEYLQEHPQPPADMPQPKESSSLTFPNGRMGSMAPESVVLVPTSPSPSTPIPTRAKLISTGPVYGIFDADEDSSTPRPDSAAPAPSMNGSTQGSPSQMGDPGPRPPVGVKRKGDALERGARSLKKTSFVHSPYVMKRKV